MAASGFTPISLYYSTTASAVPTSGNLANGELGLNINDMKLYAKNSAGTVTLLASNAGASGSVTSVSGTGTVNGLTLTGTVTTSGSLTLGGTLSGTASININGTVGATTPTTGAFTTLSTSGALTVNTTALVSSGTNNIGINTASPLTNGATYGTLTINGSNGGAIQFATAGTSIAQIYNDANSLFINPATGKSLALQIASSTVAIVSSTGLAVTGALSATTTIRTSDGVVGTPTFSFTNETSTGLYRSNNGAMSVAILGSEISRFTADGLGIGESPVASYKLTVKSAGASSATYAALMRNSSSTNLLVVRSDGYFATGTAASSPYNATTSIAANVYVDSGGQLFRSTAAAASGAQAFVAFGSTGGF
jgi:hypothetical protein